MRGFIRFLFWLIVLGCIGYFGYQAYTKWWDADLLSEKKISSAISSSTIKAKETIGEKTKQIKEKTGSYVSGVTGEAKNGIGDFVKEKIGDGISALGESIVSAGQGVAGKSVEGVQSPVTVQNIVQNYYPSASPGTNQIPSPTSTTYFKPPSTTSIITKEGTPLIFSINSNVEYTVDWGDGTIESGSESSGNIKLITHSWTTAGDYNVKISISTSSVKKDYTFPIRVY